MKAAYETGSPTSAGTRGYPVPHIIVGTEHENPVDADATGLARPAGGLDRGRASAIGKSIRRRPTPTG